MNNEPQATPMDKDDWDEALILQLPPDHDGRNSWLINHGRSDEAARLRAEWEGRT